MARLAREECEMGIGELRQLAGYLVLAVGGLLPRGVVAQSDFFAAPSISVAGIYDDNLFSTPSQPQRDFILRVTPALEAGYRSVPLMIQGRYDVDAEAYDRHSELYAAHAREQAAMDVRYQPAYPLTVAADANYIETQKPGELNLDTGLEGGRARAEHYSFHPSIAYRFDPRTAGTTSYSFTRDKVADGIETDTHTVTLSADRKLSPQDTASLGYVFREFLFDGQDNVTSHALMFGGTHAFSPRTAATFLGGPRYSDGSVDPEVSASVRHALDAGELSLAYGRSESTAIGQVGAVKTESLGAAAVYSLGRSIDVRIAPDRFSNQRGDLRANVYRVSVDVRYRVDNSVSLTGSVRSSVQKGNLDAANDDRISRNVIMIGVVVTSAERPRAERK